MKRFFVLILQGVHQLNRVEIDASGATLGSLKSNAIWLDDKSIPDEFLRFSSTNEGVIIESIDGSTFHLAGGDVSSGLLIPGELVQIGPYTLKCEEDFYSEEIGHSEQSEESLPSHSEQSEESLPSHSEQSEESLPSHSEQSEESLPSHSEQSEESLASPTLTKEEIDFPSLDFDLEVKDNSDPQFVEDDVTNVEAQELTPKLILISGNANKKTFDLVDKDQYIIGRSDDADIVIDNSSASRHHSELFFENEQFYIKDLESANGTLVNGKTISTAELSSFDIIEISGTKFQFVLLNENKEDFYINESTNTQPFTTPEAQNQLLLQQQNMSWLAQAGQFQKPIKARKPYLRIVLYLMLAVLGVGLVQKFNKDKSAQEKGDVARAPASQISEDQRGQIEAIYQRSADLYSNRQYEDAIKEAQKVLDIIPGDPRSLQLVQNAQGAIKSLNAAKETQRQQVEGELVEDQVKFYLAIGLDYINKEDYEKAEESFQKVLEIDPTNSEAERRLKFVQANMETSDDRGIASVEDTKDNSSSADALYKKGQELFDEKDYRGAIQAWNEVLQLEGDNMLKFYGKAERSIDEAEGFLEKKNAPLLDQARHGLQSGNLEEARRFSKLLLEQDPSHAEAQEILGNVSTGLHDRAKRLFTEAVIDESLVGNQDKAKEGFREIVKLVDEGDEYYEKAQSHLRKYTKE